MKTGQNRFPAAPRYPPVPYAAMNPQAVGSVPVSMEGCEDERFQQRAVTEFIMKHFVCQSRETIYKLYSMYINAVAKNVMLEF
jgi:hypothetical protein